MKTFCIAVIIFAWVWILLWMSRRAENGWQKFALPFLTAAALFFCCMAVRAVPAAFLFILGLLFVAGFGACHFLAVLNKNKITGWKHAAIVGGCAVFLTAILYTEARIIERDSYPRRPKPKIQSESDFNRFYDPENPPDKIPDNADALIPDILPPDAAIEMLQNEGAGENTLSEAAETTETAAEGEETGPVADEKPAAVEKPEPHAEQTEQSSGEIPSRGAERTRTAAVYPYALTPDYSSIYTTFQKNPALELKTSSATENALEGIFGCHVVDSRGEIDRSAVIEVKFASPEQREICSVSHIARGDGDFTVIVHPLKAGTACLEVSSPETDMSSFVLVIVSGREEQ